MSVFNRLDLANVNPFALTHAERRALFATESAAPPTSPSASPPETHVTNCLKCGGRITAANKSGICTRCQKPNRFLDRPEKTETETEPTIAVEAVLAPLPDAVSKLRPSRPETGNDLEPLREVDDFRRLAASLSVDGDAMLREFCSAWVQCVRAAAVEAQAAVLGPRASKSEVSDR